MIELDGDEVRISSRGRFAERDIVQVSSAIVCLIASFKLIDFLKILLLPYCLSLALQFVPFRDYIDHRGNHILSMARLAKDVLAEIPDQFLLYMRTRGIKPNLSPPCYSLKALSAMPHQAHPLQTQI